MSVDVGERVDSLCRFLDFPSDGLWDKLGNELLQGAGRSFLLDDLEHLLTDLSDLGGLCVGSLLDLVRSASSSGHNEKSDEVSVGSPDIIVSLDERLPLSYKRSELVLSEGHSVEVGKTRSTLNFINS